MKRITGQVIKDLYAYITKKHGTKTKYKPNAVEAKIIAFALDKVTILDYVDFMKNYAFVLGKTIYLPFEVGDKSNYSYNNQISVLGHEHTHILHSREVGNWKWNYKYVFKPGFRMEAEIKAYICTMELNHFLTGRLSTPSVYASLLYDYSLSKTDVRIAESAFTKSNLMIERGFYQCQLTKEIRGFLK